MSYTISGDYNTTEVEVEYVIDYLKKIGIKKEEISEIRKYDQKDELQEDGDVLVTFTNGKTSLIEVKEESWERFTKYKEYGIDMLSVFFLKKGIDACQWKGLHTPDRYDDFIKAIDKKATYITNKDNSGNIVNDSFKKGKLYYSKSDIWLFVCKDHRVDKYIELKGYDFKRMKRDKIHNSLQGKCSFAINNKGIEGYACTDPYLSSCFFVKPSLLNDYLITKKNQLF